MNISRRGHKLTHTIDSKRNIRACQGEILEGTDNTAIPCSILGREWSTTSQDQLIRREHRSWHATAGSHVRPGQKIPYVLVLCQDHTIRIMMNLNAKKITEIAKILNSEIISKLNKQFVGCRRRRTDYKNIINIDKDVNLNTSLIKDG
jgi:hypothetical protein